MKEINSLTLDRRVPKGDYRPNMNRGILLLVERYRGEFRRENEGLYSEEDYKEAKRRYIKLRLFGYL